MKRALPTIALSAAGLAWLLHAQGVIDTSTTTTDAPAASGTPGATAPNGGRGSPPSSGATPSTTAAGLPVPGRTPPSSSTPTTTATPAKSGGSTNGPTINTRFGPVQVAVVISGGKLTDVKVLQSPTHARRSQQINDQALPILHDEAIAAQNADIDLLSGATITSDAYAQSLQKALDDAGFKH